MDLFVLHMKDGGPVNMLLLCFTLSSYFSTDLVNSIRCICIIMSCMILYL